MSALGQDPHLVYQHLPNPHTMNRIISAISFAAAKHRNQRRKDHEASPYINHPIALANVLANEAMIDDERVLIAAVLHDTIEDTETTEQELNRLFGAEIWPPANRHPRPKTLHF